ncbi:hypothetical protein GOP47_0021605 [Adiantum capillus-veneris]|uniref:tRNA/rRNA methyltransferase SpoU type domain-containing protein n=1 Tax=Adiantum capillus-veneris TaxID=13818 RepID=A0A9D4U7T9_ADICA|nr:hypothetical protein GOP47_0021605 [Adiantum capillus-veneris]
MSTLCKLLLHSGDFCCSLVCNSRKPWSRKLARPSSTFHTANEQRFLCVSAQSNHKDQESHDALRPWTSAIGETIKESSNPRHLHIVLFQPQIAGNTGSIARTCAAASIGLHLIEPLGFQIDDAKLKRAGLDYWPYVFVKVHASWSDFMHYFKQQEGEKRLVAFTKRGTCLYTDKEYKAGDWLVFGSETSGLSAQALEDCSDQSNYGGGKVRIPMLDTYLNAFLKNVQKAFPSIKMSAENLSGVNISLIQDFHKSSDSFNSDDSLSEFNFSCPLF